MGHHEHNHCHEHDSDDNQKALMLKLIFAGLFFIGGFFYHNLFWIAYIIVGYDIIFKAIQNLFHGDFFDENSLMTIATFGALYLNELPEAVSVMFLYQIGEFLQDKATEKTKKSISDLMDIKPEFVNLIDENQNIKQILPSEAKIGDIAVVNSGEKIPLDGIIVEGCSNLNTSPITGESAPRKVEVGDSIISGCINLDGVFKFRIQKTYEQSTVAKILELVEHAQNKKTNTENFIKKFATIYTPIVVLIAVLFVFCGTFIFNFAFSDVLKRALTFLVISCPCALVISIPLSFFAGIGKASQEGVLIKGSSYIETLTKIKEAVFDKTGTLTKGKFEVSEINSENPDILKFAAFAEASSNHPIAIAIKEKWGKDIPVNTSIKEIAGSGVTSQIEGVEVKLGKANFVGVEPIETDGTVVYVSLNGEYVGNLVVKDSVKATSKDAISELKDLKIHTTMLTGDTKNVALTVQKELEIDDIYFEQTPQNKVENLEKIMSKTNGKTLFVGDGVNDAPVIMRADIGISMGGMGSDSAIEASDIVIMNDNLLSIVKAINISKKTLNITKQNIIFAIGIKILFLLLGSFGLMTIWGAVFADVGVTMLTICNSLRIFR